MEREKKFYKIDLDNLVIPYDRDRNYNDPERNPEGADTYLPPYSSYKFNSIYEGIIIEMHIVDHCNLNCCSCNHFCPIATPKYIEVEDFRNQLIALNENVPNIKDFIIIGGEPTLHPKLLEICIIARQILRKAEIRVLTNGVNLENVIEKKDYYKSLRISFDICNYPSYTNLEHYKILKEAGIAEFNNSRVIMQQIIVDEEGKENYIDNYYNCPKHQLPCFTLRDYKLYICPFMEHSRHYFAKVGLEYPIEESDYLDIRTIGGDIDKLQTYIFTPKKFCKYCARKGEIIPWNRSSFSVDEYKYSLREMYFKNYDLYEKIINIDETFFKKSFDKKYNPCGIREDFLRQETTNLYKLRYLTGKIDIIIPYYNLNKDQIDELENTLVDQTIIKDCVIYFISDNSPNEKEVFNRFHNHKILNCIMLKMPTRSGPGAARQKGLDNSYRDFVFFLDADDKFLRNDLLEILYKIFMTKNELNVIFFNCFSNLNKKNASEKTSYCIKKDFLNTNNIQFNNWYYGEDYLFMSKLYAFLPDSSMSISIGPSIGKTVLYNEKNETNLSTELQKINNWKEKIFFVLLSARLEYLYYLIDHNIFNENIWNNALENVASWIKEYNNEKMTDFMICYCYYYCLKAKNANSICFKNFDFKNFEILKYQVDNNIINFNINNNIINNHDKLILYLIDYIEKNFNNKDLLIQPTVEDILTVLKDEVKEDE